MTEPMTVAIATALAGKAVEVAGEPVRAAVMEITRRVRERFHGRPSEERALARGAEEPEILQGAVRRLLDEDPDFRSELEGLWNQAHTEASATDDGVVNVFSGQAQSVIQLRDINGNLNIG
ncbi:hypothetical protein BZB76_4975 [Actinomadura pelletieri DSM 43383]|uniref:Uncharacterized protein n=1 Tax=Actinomadura pelletieri DSM 43383 TaxID=1120940 RepID=A0A495QJ41_9ACTN|nr:hypothetical protein [Actinomadura pelletieri]RKS72158.1 hypothetical protein BZB76_4975 [Actinomadura pelletieri DSM 43383]